MLLCFYTPFYLHIAFYTPFFTIHADLHLRKFLATCACTWYWSCRRSRWVEGTIAYSCEHEREVQVVVHYCCCRWSVYCESICALLWDAHIFLLSMKAYAFLSGENPSTPIGEEDDPSLAISITPTSAFTFAPFTRTCEDNSVPPIELLLPTFTAHGKHITISPTKCPYPTTYPHSS